MTRPGKRMYAKVMAVAAGASVIVTGDEDLLVIDRYNGIDIVSPRAFFSRLSS